MARPLRIAVVAGEASGDLLGASVIGALRARCDDVEVLGVGGPQLQAQGLQSLFPMERLSVMGLLEPLKRLPELLYRRRSLLRQLVADPPDLFLGIDAPDFNLSLERRLRRAGIRTAHLVSPSVWAWRQGRIRGIGRAVDLMLCLFPFETDIYRRHGIPVRFIGHPLADEIPRGGERDVARASLGLDSEGKVVALLPGSRAAEVQAMAPLFLEAAAALWRDHPQLTFLLPAATPERERELRQLLQAWPQLPVCLLRGQSREVLAASDAALLASGTATLEAALLKCPMVVAYRTGGLSWRLLSWLVSTPWVALPNILAGRELVPELLQDAATPGALQSALEAQLFGAGDRQLLLGEYDAIHASLQQDCAAQAAEALLQLATFEDKAGDGAG